MRSRSCLGINKKRPPKRRVGEKAAKRARKAAAVRLMIGLVNELRPEPSELEPKKEEKEEEEGSKSVISPIQKQRKRIMIEKYIDLFPEIFELWPFHVDKPRYADC
jgi:hypothetical protein